MSLPHREVAHLWANQVVNRRGQLAAERHNLSFREGKLFSYATCIAEIRASGVILMSSRFHSKSTSTHRGYAREALSPAQRARVIVVPSLSLSPEATLIALAQEIADLQQKAKRAKTLTDHYNDVARAMIDGGNRYIAEFGLRVAPFEIDADYAAVVAARMAEQAAAAAVRRKAEEAEHAKREATNRRKFRAGKMAYLYGPVLLRLQAGHPEILETSKGARVPLNQAIRIASLALACRTKGEAFQPALVAPKVGDFALTRIDADGTIVVGCHEIAWKETSRLAKAIKVTL